MKHLFDTCTFFNELSSPNEIINLGRRVKENKEKICITNFIWDELQPHRHLDKEKIEQSTGIINGLQFCEDNLKSLETIRILENSSYKMNYNDIRKRYYSHINARELKRRITNGEITEKDAKKLKKKDCGECSCIAIAITDPRNICIVSEDEGKICERPEINIFDIYRRSHNIMVFKFISWLDREKIEL